MAADETDAQKRERQSKALGAAFLAHQVSELETKVDTLTFSRDSRSNGGGRGTGRGGARGGRGGPQGGGGQPVKKRETRVVDASVLIHALPVLKRWVREDAYLLIVPLSALSTLDALKRAPPRLADLSRQATLFLETQLNIARQLSSAFSPAEADARIRLRAQKAEEELPWTEVEMLWEVPEDWEVVLPPGVEVPPQHLEEGEEPQHLPLPTAGDIPRHLRSTLQCVLYFHRKQQQASAASSLRRNASPAAPTPVAVIYNSLLPTPPPLHHSLAKLVYLSTVQHSSPRKSSRDPSSSSPPLDFLSLSSGDALSYYLSHFFPSLSSSSSSTASTARIDDVPASTVGEPSELLYPVPSTAVVAASAWLKSQATAMQAAREKERSDGSAGRGGAGGGGGGRDGRGRGGGGGGGPERGGRGGGGGKAPRRPSSSGGAGEKAGAARTLFVP